MHIDTFEDEFEDKILQRGLGYYNNNYIRSLERISADRYQAEVEGSEIYDVEIDMDDDGYIDDAYCNCPYDWGYCKHIAAVLYALRNNPKIAVTHNDLPSLIGKCSKAQLLEIILEHTKEDKDFKNYIKMKLSESSSPDTILADFKNAADKVFDEYFDTDMLYKAADILFSRTEKIKDPVDRIRIYAELLRYCVDSIGEFYNMEYDDDYTLFDIIGEAQEILTAAVELIISDNEPEKTAAVWDILTANYNCKSDYDDEDRFFDALMFFADIPEYRIKVDELLSAEYETARTYDKCYINRKRFEIIEKYGTKKEENDFINSHLDDDYFRRLAITSAMSAKNYVKAEQLALDGEKQDADKPGIVRQWREKRYEIYKASGDKDKLRDICRVLIIHGDSNLYSEWKRLMPKENFNTELEKLLSEANSRTYEYIILKEKMADRIYELCRKSPQNISEYFGKLKGSEFEEKGRELYEKYIRNMADRVCDRSGYKDVCQLLKKFSKECSVSLANKMAADFRAIYKRKSAFMDELNKSGFYTNIQ